MTKQNLVNLKKTSELTKDLKSRFNNVINTLKVKHDDLDRYGIDDLFSKAVKLTNHNNGDTLSPMLDYNIRQAMPYIDDLEDSIGNMPEKAVDNDSPKAVQKEDMLSFVENNFIYHRLEWYVVDDDETKVRFIDVDTAIKAIIEMKNSVVVF